MNKRLTLISVLTLLMLSLYLVHHYLPSRHHPFKPLSIDEPPGLAIAFQLQRIKKNPKLCFTTLRNSKLVYQRLHDRQTGKNCGFSNAVLLQQSEVSYGGDISLSCPALVSLAIWEQHELQPLAQQLFGQNITQIQHYGTYACRNINNASSGQRSQHAYANAIDISGFVLADGRRITVQHDWQLNNDKGKFLRSLHRQACRYFSTVLGPNYNALHHDHLHMDMGFYQTCR